MIRTLCQPSPNKTKESHKHRWIMAHSQYDTTTQEKNSVSNIWKLYAKFAKFFKVQKMTFEKSENPTELSNASLNNTISQQLTWKIANPIDKYSRNREIMKIAKLNKSNEAMILTKFTKYNCNKNKLLKRTK